MEPTISPRGPGEMAKRHQYPNPEPALTFPEAAERLGAPVSDLYRLWHEGRIRAVSVFGRWRIDPGELEAIREILGVYPSSRVTDEPQSLGGRRPPNGSDTISSN